MGAMALAWGYFAGKLAEVIVLAFTKTSHKFVLPSFKGLGPIFSFGSKATGAQFVGSMGVSSADLAMGGFLGLAAAGLFSRGMSLVGVYRTGIEQALSPVAFSAFAQERRNPQGDLRKVYLHSLTLLSAVGWPAFAVLAILARPLVLVLFGDRWAGAIPVAQILACSGLIYVLSSLAPRLLSALGKVGSLLKRELAIQIPRITMILLGAQHSIEGVALAITATYALAFVVNQAVVQSVIAISYRDLWHAVGSSVAVSAIAGPATWATSRIMLASGAPPVLELIVSALAASISWLAAVLLFKHPIKHEVLTAWRHVRQRF
jgi:O-antigen/teichoic acid export membrane protein